MFIALVLGVLLLVAANRHPLRSVLAGIDARNPWLRRMALAVLLLLGLVFGVPALCARSWASPWSTAES